MALASCNREQLRRRMTRPLFAKVRVGWRAHGGGDPDPALLIEHWIVHVVLAGPDDFIAPVGRRLWHRRLRRRRRLRIADRQLHLAPCVAYRIENGKIIRAQLEGTIDEAVGID